MPTWRPCSSTKTMPEKFASTPSPALCTVTPFTVTAAPVLLARVKVVNGTRDVPPGAKELAGCAAPITVMPGPVGTTGPGVVPGVVGVVATVQRLFAFARVSGPQYPAVGETPFAAWNVATAALVREPK